MIWNTLLLCLTGAAVYKDVREHRIPNRLILTGYCCGVCGSLINGGVQGMGSSLIGGVLPIVLLWMLFRIRVLGAGDLKLLGAVGSFLGPRNICFCIAFSFLTGAVTAVVLMIWRHNFLPRLTYLYHYIFQSEKNMKSKLSEPYQRQADPKSLMCFSVPVFLSVAAWIGGIYGI